MTTRVFDVNGEERSLDWLAQQYDGCHPEFVASRLDMTSYARYFALAAVYVTEGPAVCKVEVRGEAGEPLHQPVCLSWPSLADPDHGLQDLAGSGAPFLWTRRGVAQFTETPTGGDGLRARVGVRAAVSGVGDFAERAERLPGGYGDEGRNEPSRAVARGVSVDGDGRRGGGSAGDGGCGVCAGVGAAAGDVCDAGGRTVDAG